MRQPWSDVLTAVASAIGVSLEDRPTFAAWLVMVRMNAESSGNPCVKIIPFLEEEFVRMATGRVVLDTTRARSASTTLASSRALSQEHLLKFVEYWKTEKFI